MDKHDFIQWLNDVLENNEQPFIKANMVFNLSPEAIRSVKAKEDCIEFTAQFKGHKAIINVLYEDIIDVESVKRSSI